MKEPYHGIGSQNEDLKQHANPQDYVESDIINDFGISEAIKKHNPIHSTIAQRQYVCNKGLKVVDLAIRIVERPPPKNETLEVANLVMQLAKEIDHFHFLMNKADEVAGDIRDLSIRLAELKGVGII
jgi:hypothetical protein